MSKIEVPASDTNNEDSGLEQDPDPTYPPDEALRARDLSGLEIDVREDPFTISELVRKIDSAPPKLVLDPDFQRLEVWDLKRKSQFIESILLNYPLPPLYLNQLRDGRYLVVDGLQRTSSVYRFVKGDFELQGMETLVWLDGQKFTDLEPRLQSRIEDRKLNCYILKPSVPLGAVYQIFARVNRGGMPLNQQEIRNALNQGPATKLLKDLADIPSFRDWIGVRLNQKRMVDREAALRCVAFGRINPLAAKAYPGNLESFIESTLKQLNDVSADKERKTLAKTFDRIFAIAQEILGEDAFRLETERTRGRLNMAVMETVYHVFSQHTDNWLRKNKKRLSTNYRRLLRDETFLSTVSHGTGSSVKVRTRFKRARDVLEAGCAN